MKSVYVGEEVCIGCGLRPGYFRPAHCWSKDFIKVIEKERPRPLPLGSNGDLGGKRK